MKLLADLAALLRNRAGTRGQDVADFMIPNRDALEWVLDGFGIPPSSDDFNAALVMLASVPCGGEVWKIKIATELEEPEIERWKEAMIREGVWPGLISWGTSLDDANFCCDLFSVVGKLRRIVYGSGEVKYIDSKVKPEDGEGRARGQERG